MRIVNVPSFLHSTGLSVDVPDFGRLVFDVAYGGNFYVIIEAQESYRDLADISAFDIQRLSPIVRRLVNEKYTFVHPEDPTISGVRHVMWTGKPKHPEADGRNAVFYGEKAIDRSPCGTGTSARLAQLAARGDAEGRRRFRPRIDHRQPLPRPRREGDDGRRLSTPSCRRSPGRRGSPATTRSSSTTATPS